MSKALKLSWDNVKVEQLSDTFSRQLIYLENVMVARIVLKKGAYVPAHKHVSEQITMILEGELEFEIGGEKIRVKAGENLSIPSEVEHAALAIEDTVDIDVFSPVRQDWLSGEDSYLRR